MAVMSKEDMMRMPIASAVHPDALQRTMSDEKRILLKDPFFRHTPPNAELFDLVVEVSRQRQGSRSVASSAIATHLTSFALVGMAVRRLFLVQMNMLRQEQIMHKQSAPNECEKKRRPREISQFTAMCTCKPARAF